MARLESYQIGLGQRSLESYNDWDVDSEATYVDQLTSDPKNKVVIYGGSVTSPISGFIDAETVFGASASYNAEQLGYDAANAANKIASSAENSGIGGIHANKRTNSVKLSRQSWQSSSFNTLAFDLFVVATKDGQNPMTEGIKIYDYLLPIELNLGFMIVPGNYYVNPFGGEAINAVSVFIGEWFSSPNSWLMSAGQMTVSKQKQENGIDPLFVKISITLTPARDFYADEVQDWFVT